MPLPPSLTIKTLHGRYSALPNGDAPAGTVDFVAPAVLRVAADDTIVLPSIYTATVTSGQFTALLPATDDPAISPTGWSYEVVERLTGHPVRRYRIVVPVAAAGTLELSDLQPATTVIPAASYATTAQLVALSTRVDELEANPGATSDHGELTGLGDDDHAQYYNAARLTTALTPYATIAAVTTGLASKADLVGGKVPQAQIPAVALVEFLGAVADQTAMLALTGQRGDWATRTDLGTDWQLIADDPTQLVSWREHVYPASPVTSVAGRTGAVTLTKTDVALSNVDNTSDAAKPVSTATQTALDTKAGKPRIIRVRDTSQATTYAVPNTGGAWEILTGPGEIVLAAAVGDDIEVTYNVLAGAAPDWSMDIAVITGATPTIVRYMATGTSTPGFLGTPSQYPVGAGFQGHTGAALGFTVAPSDLDTGNVRLAVVVKSSTASGGLFASANYPFHWTARNHGPVN